MMFFCSLKKCISISLTHDIRIGDGIHGFDYFLSHVLDVQSLSLTHILSLSRRCSFTERDFFCWCKCLYFLFTIFFFIKHIPLNDYHHDSVFHFYNWLGIFFLTFSKCNNIRWKLSLSRLNYSCYLLLVCKLIKFHNKWCLVWWQQQQQLSI